MMKKTFDVGGIDSDDTFYADFSAKYEPRKSFLGKQTATLKITANVIPLSGEEQVNIEINYRYTTKDKDILAQELLAATVQITTKTSHTLRQYMDAQQLADFERNAVRTVAEVSGLSQMLAHYTQTSTPIANRAAAEFVRDIVSHHKPLDNGTALACAASPYMIPPKALPFSVTAYPPKLDNILTYFPHTIRENKESLSTLIEMTNEEKEEEEDSFIRKSFVDSYVALTYFLLNKHK